MKPLRRELNVFSISALDLFASGMGVFVLLAIIAIPFFPNTGDSEVRIEDLEGELEVAQTRVRALEGLMARMQQESDMHSAVAVALSEAQQQLEDASSQIRELEWALAQGQDASRELELEQQLAAMREVLAEAQARVSDLEAASRELKLPPLDVVICLDVTGSMTNQVEGIKREIASLARVLDRVAPSVGIGIVAFGDRRWTQPIHRLAIVETTRLSRITAFINSLRANMDPNWSLNLDQPEAVATAMNEAMSMPWREASEKRYVIVITDNAAYPERVTTAIAAARSFRAQQGHFVSAVRANFPYDPVARDAALRFLRDLAQAGGGNFVDAAGGESMLSTILLAILGT